MDMVTIKVNGEEKQYPAGTAYEKVASDFKDSEDARIGLVLENGRIRELKKTVKQDAEISFITLKRSSGHKAYVRTAILVMVKAIDDVLGHDKSKQVKVEFAIGNGYYISPKGGLKVDRDFLDKLDKRMREIIAAALPISKRSISTDEARELFAKAGMEDKNRLFRFRRSSLVNVYSLDGYDDYYYGYMLPDASYIEHFSLELYEDGFMLVLPESSEPDVLKPFVPRPGLFGALKTADDWGAKLGIDSVGDLNERICSGGLGELVLAQEALQAHLQQTHSPLPVLLLEL